MKRMLLVDGNSIMNNCFFGMPLLSTDDGVYTNAVVGTVNVLIKYLNELHPDYCAVAFDVHEPTFRHKAYAEYKAGRHRMPEELVPQFPLVKECIAALGIRIIEAPGYEADDILGTCASWAGNETDAYIITGDKDAFQLIRDNVFVLYKGRNGISSVGREEFSARYPGVTPETFPEFKALLGDTSDNIKGVAGIGEKSALELVSAYGTLENIYENIREIKPVWAKKLESGREDAFFSRFLAQIKCDSPVGTDLEGIRYRGIDADKCEDIFSRLRMGKALEACREISGTVEAAPSEYPYTEYSDTFSSDACGRFCAFDGKNLYDGIHRFCLSPENISSLLRDASREVAVADGKKFVSEYGRAACGIFDVTLAAYVVDSSKSDPDLKHLAMKYFGVTLGDVFDSAALIYDLAAVLKQKLRETSQEKIYSDIELPLTSVLSDMEKTGFRVDRKGLSDFSAELGKLSDGYTSEIYRCCGHEFNINSPKQLGKVLFEELGLPQGKKTQSGYSTNIEVLEKIRMFHPVVDLIIDYRKVTKLRSTYTEGLLAVADPQGRVHSTFNQKIAATGRLSSSEPNLQNIPVRTELGRRMRKYFIADDGYVLVDADYSQIELRVLAAVSGDRNMINSFLLGEDIHSSTAASVFRIPLSSVTSEQRKQAKAINFGIIYGMSAFSLAEDIGVTRAEAAEYIRNYFAGFPEIDGFLSETVGFAKKNGYVTTAFGRRRYIPELSSPKKPVQAAGERIARNSPIQGTAADIIKIAMINVSAALRREKIDARLVLQVHDELIVEARSDCADKAAEILKREMENAVELAVPLIAETAVGGNWLECH